MTFQDWQNWRDAGMDIGLHTSSHAELTKLTRDDALNEVATSR
jgi:peptidoglycan/xylan/chitin deacetylase (PgdA/CDA1 family)